MSKDEAVKDETVAEPVAPESAPEENQAADGDNSQVTDSTSDNFFAEEDAKVAEGTKEDVDDSTETPEETPGQARGEDGKFTSGQTEDKPLAPKSENRFQKLANENRDLKEQLDRLKLQETQLATEQELLTEVNPDTGEYYTPQEVERLAFAQSREQQQQAVAQERYQLEVQQNQDTIRSEAQKALTEFPMFDETNKQAYNPDMAAQADMLLQQALIFDNGVLVGSTISPYQLYKTIADATTSNDPKRQAAAQKATEKMLANADVAPGASQATKTKVDPMMAAFDEEAARL